MTECPVCAGSVELQADAVKGELVECSECGTELEVSGINPVALKEAPQEEEDWGQ